MEKLCAALSNKLSEAGVGKFAIFYEDELLDELPKNVRGRETLEAALKILAGEGCIEVKYARRNAFCIAFKRAYMPPKCDLNQENDNKNNESAKAKLPLKFALIFMLFSFLGALSGAALGALFL